MVENQKNTTILRVISKATVFFYIINEIKIQYEKTSILFLILLFNTSLTIRSKSSLNMKLVNKSNVLSITYPKPSDYDLFLLRTTQEPLFYANFAVK